MKDNGVGITLSNLKSVGQRHWSTKMTNNLYGSKGVAIHSLSLIGVVEIKTYHPSNINPYCKVLMGGECISLKPMMDSVREFGTLITVSSIFQGMPVRQKCMKASKETSKIIDRIQRIAILHPKVSFVVKDPFKNYEHFKLGPHTCDSSVEVLRSLYGNEIGFDDFVFIDYQECGYYIQGMVLKVESYHKIKKGFRYLYINRRYTTVVDRKSVV